jgi:hypothetical protein
MVTTGAESNAGRRRFTDDFEPSDDSKQGGLTFKGGLLTCKPTWSNAWEGMATSAFFPRVIGRAAPV